MWIGLKCKNTTDGLEGRPLICTENPSSNKTKHCHLKKLETIVHIYNISQLSLLLLKAEFQLFQQKKRKTIQMQQVVLCHLYLVSLQIKQCIF